MPLPKDISNQIFGRLKVQQEYYLISNKTQKKRKYSKCICDCGNTFEALSQSLISGNTKSCGCLLKEEHKNVENLIGKKFGRYLVISRPDNKHIEKDGKKRGYWKCKCDCGNIVDVLACNLIAGNSVSCGCYKLEQLSINNTTHGHSKIGKTSLEYTSWEAMKSRCYNKNNSGYGYYGGRGITVCDRWLGENGFINFYSDMGSRLCKEYSIDRIDVNGNYEPSNCRWATKIEQSINRRNSIKLPSNKKSTSHKKYNISFESVFNSRKRKRNYTSQLDDLNAEQAMEILKFQNYKCAYFYDCKNSEENGCKLQIDHKIAKFNGGHDTKENIQWVCRSCNASKGTKDKPKPIAERNRNRGSLDKTVFKQDHVEDPTNNTIKNNK